MTNFEKFSKDMKTTIFAVINGKPEDCNENLCNICEFRIRSRRCAKNRMEWLKAEYKERPKITIPDNTPIDAKVLVSDNGEDWFKRHYAGCVMGVHMAWNEGRTSWSSNTSNKVAWEYMKEYVEPDENKI